MKKIKPQLAAIHQMVVSREDKADPYCLLKWLLHGEQGTEEIKTFRTNLIRLHLKSQREIKTLLA